VIIQIAKAEDVPDLVNFSRQLHSASLYKRFEFATDKVQQILADTIAGDPKQGMVLVAKENGKAVGAVGSTVITPHYSNDRIAAEWLWYVEKGQSPRLLLNLLGGLEYWAQNVAGCKAVMLGRINNNTTSFRKRGYTATETTLIKEL
jgi:hypothetical protein